MLDNAAHVSAPSLTRRATAALSRVAPWLVIAWAAGVLVLSIRNLGAWIAVRQLRSLTTRAVDESLVRRAAALSDRLGMRRAVRLLQSTRVDSPLVIGLFKPVILLPASVLTELPAAQIEALLAHELAHVRRHDYLMNLLQCLIETLLFYHPAVWWVSRQLRIEREHCCDDLAIAVTRQRMTYARALAALADVRVTHLAPAASGGVLMPRLRRILGLPDPDVARPAPWAAGVLAVAACLAGILIARSQAPARAAVTPHDADDVVQVHGRVLDPTGHPAAGATVRAFSGWWSPDPRAPLSQVSANADGRFTISFRESAFDHVRASWEDVTIAATAPGVAPAWARWDDVDGTGEMILRLAPDDVPIEGRILDLEGNPVRGARVTLESLHPHAVRLKDLNIDGSEKAKANAGPVAWLPGWAVVPDPVLTGADGTFRMSGLGRARKASLEIRGPGITRSEIEVLTLDAPRESRVLQEYLAGTFTTYGARFDYNAAPGRIVSGTVRDAETGATLAGVVVSHGAKTCTTDVQGRYRVEGVPTGAGQRMQAKPNADQPYFIRQMPVPDAPGLGPVTVDFELHRGLWVSGRVTDKVTGKPVVARVTFQPYLTNPFAAKLPEFHEQPQPSCPDGGGDVNTLPDGSYRVVGMPGPALVVASFPKEPYLPAADVDRIKCPRRAGGFAVYKPYVGMKMEGGIRDVDIPPGARNTTLDFQFDPGPTIHVTIVDPQGKPLSGVVVGPERPGYIGFTRCRSAQFEARAFRPGEARRYFFRYAPGNLGKAMIIKQADAPNGELTVRLEPWTTVTGRLIGEDGQPLADAMLQPYMFNGPMFGTDAQGRFALTLVPGLPYGIRGIKGRDEFDTEVQALTVKPGENKDLGDVHTKPF